MESKSKIHVQIPNKIGGNSENSASRLLSIDYYVYACLRKYMNKTTYQTYVGISTVSKNHGVTPVGITNSISRLIESGDIKKTNQQVGRSYVYEFNKDSDKFEMFTPDFLNIDFLTPTEKGIFIALQKYMYKDGTNTMVTTYTFEELSKKSGIPMSSIKRAFRSYKKNNITNIIPTRVKDPISGILRQAKMVDLGVVCQSILYVNERVDNLEEKFNKLLEENRRMQQQLDILANAQIGNKTNYTL